MPVRSIGRGFTAALVLLASLIAVGPATAQKIPVRAAYVPAVTWLAAWVAKEEGYFDEQGLDVSFIAVQNISLVPGTVGKQLDIAPATVIDLINAVGGGIDVVAVTGNHSDTPDHVTNTVIVRKDSGIKSVKDFAGKTVATPTVGAILHIALLHWMKKEGVDINSIRAVEVPFPNMPDQMQAGRAALCEPYDRGRARRARRPAPADRQPGAVNRVDLRPDLGGFTQAGHRQLDGCAQ
jgi:NitT/TauT family transport system substrate-binding protein